MSALARLSATPAPGPWFLGGAAAGVLGVLAGLQHLAELPAPLPWALAAGGLALLGWRWRIALLPALWAAAVAWGSAAGARVLADRLPSAWEGRDLQVQALVSELPQALDGLGGVPAWRLVLTPLGPAHTGDGLLRLPQRLSVSYAGEQRPRAGEVWRFGVRLKRVHALQNPGLPDVELWLLERGIGAQGSVRSAERLQAAPWWRLAGWRQALRDRIDTQLPGNDNERARAVIAGLVLGDQAALAAGDWALLRDAGVVHLFSISGLHITGFAWLAAWALRRVWPLAWMRVLPAPLAARWAGLLLAAAYAALAGWGVPAQRTVLLLAAVTLLQASGRLWPWPLALLAAALPVALADPWALVQPGFWLSFAAVALLMQQGRAARPAWQELLHTQAVVTLGLAPLSLLFFGQLSLLGALANLVAVPLVTCVLTPLALLGVLLPVLWTLAGALTHAFFAALTPLAGLPAAVLSLPLAPASAHAMALIGLVLAALRLPRWGRALGLGLMLPMLLARPELPAPGEFELRVVDVGQGSAAWVRTATHLLVVDTGPRWGAGSDAGARVLLPSLRAAGVRRVDALLLSHGDVDHAGGAASLMQALPPGQLWRSADPRLLPLGGRGCSVGQGWTWDGVRFEFLHPPAGGSAPRSANAGSCVLRVQAASGASLLMPADIGAAEEAALHMPPSSVLLLAHHGSGGSNSDTLLDAVRPRLAFAQAGYRSRHGHPALATQNRLRERGVPLLVSADCGAWRWRSDEPPSVAGCWREQRRRYWQQTSLRIDADTELPPQGPPEPPDTMSP